MDSQFIFPRGRVTIGSLTNVAKTVLAAGKHYKITHIVVTGGLSAEIVKFRSVGGATEYFRCANPAYDTTVLPGFDLPDTGLEVITDTVAGDVWLTVFYVSIGG